MKSKTARRFFARNKIRIALSNKPRSTYRPQLKALRRDQRNPASRRAFQQALQLLATTR